MRGAFRWRLALFVGLWAFASLLGSAAAQLELRFFNVGQGDAVLIRAPSGQVVLYDGGQDRTEVRDALLREGISAIDLIVASHAHADHIGGLAAVVEALPVRFFMDNALPATTQTYERLMLALAERDVALLEAGARTLTLGEVRLIFLPMPGEPSWGQNDNSVGLIVEYGEFRATLLGDSEPRQQGWWLQRASDLLAPVTLHKASHHGSRNGDTDAMIGRLRPELVIISVGAENRYGHPHSEALARYAAVGAVVLRTDQQGTVVVLAEPDGSYEVGFSGAAPASTPRVAPLPPVGAPAGAAASSCVDINRASEQELTRIVHIGLERARDLIAQRPYQSLDQLTRVSGIGPARLRDILSEGLACIAAR